MDVRLAGRRRRERRRHFKASSFALARRCWFRADSFRFLMGDLEPREKGLARHHRADMGDQGIVAAGYWMGKIDAAFKDRGRHGPN